MNECWVLAFHNHFYASIFVSPFHQYFSLYSLLGLCKVLKLSLMHMMTRSKKEMEVTWWGVDEQHRSNDHSFA
jgi:hypothetical protein